MRKYLEGIDAVTGTRRSIARLADVLGEMPTPKPAVEPALVPAGAATSKSFFRDVGVAASDSEPPDGIGTLVGLAAGAVAVPSHRVLGGIGGASLGRNVPALFRAEQRTAALRNMGVTAAGIAGSLAWKAHPIAGFAVGSVVGGVVAYLAGARR